ncbi:patatin-like phospholipase family protein [Arenibacter troitsensis]|uniref:Patatin-like phospholipase n=1 Tax=Arenibacter troitsensis TaxID=188872 RepID=A0A1X7L2A4_9FLAO|nr:patatin-like phospholipase family protein [Arenibacter troitsensis]MDX1769309.1 patatin-like phospholipase family protein [Arenibacter troitsensis]SMG47342.1 Patatin-like phospholipase [Arenibacter troitsensis]
MKALVISGGGSKGAFAGGVAQYLMEVEKREYDILVGTSTGSLLIPQLALNQIDKLHNIYTNVSQRSIFSLNPFVVRKKGDREYVSINFLNTFLQFVKSKRTFGESKALRRTIRKNFSEAEFRRLKKGKKDIVVTVSNLSKNRIEYKSIMDFSYDEFCDWIWISCNYIPFMSLVKKDGFEYGDGGLGCVVPIREAIRRGATEIDAIILESENMEHNKVLGKNPFSLMLSIYGFVLDQIEYHDISEGVLAAKHNGVQLNLYYTPTKLTENSLVFNKKLMSLWWQQGYKYAEDKFSSVDQ